MLVRLCTTHPVLSSLTLPHLLSIHDERHCAAVLRAGVCAVCRNLIYPSIGTLSSFFSPHPIHSCFYPWIHTSAALLCFDVYPLIFILVMLALRDLSHIGTILVYFISPLVLFLQPISSSRGRPP